MSAHPGVSTEVGQAIEAELTALERAEDVAVLLAVESGSRAWGFASTDSDYDVRFVYARRPEWYLSIDLEDRRDVIERPIRDSIDVSGWDVRKALKLFRKSNPPLLEWLQCPIVYRQRSSLAGRLRALLPEFYSPRGSFHHYLHMAQGNLREYLRGDTVWRKKYFYVLRPLLAMLWIERGLGPVPIEFGRLLEATVTDPRVRQAIDELLEAKRAGAELDRGPAIPELGGFIAMEMARLEGTAAERPTSAPAVEQLDALFRDTLAEVWSPAARGLP
jgi:predicted nucleotidyltransferase